MSSFRVLALLAVGALSFKLTTCRSPGEQGRGATPEAQAAADVTLPGVDTAALTAREKQDWSTYVSELLAPCPDQPVSLAQCVKEARDCKQCLPATRFLVRQVQRGNARSKIEAAFRTRFAPEMLKPVPIEGAPWKGVADAPVVIVEWADFECPFCGAARAVLDSKLEAFPGKVKLVFHNYPLSIHQHAETAARAAVAAGKQGKFWEMHRALFENQKDLERSAIEKLAQKLGLDMKKFTDDLESEEVADAVSRDRKAGDALGLEGTPLIYVNGRHFNLDFFDISDDLDDWIALEIEQRTGQVVKPLPVKAEAEPDDPVRPDPMAKPEGSTAPSERAAKSAEPSPKAAPGRTPGALRAGAAASGAPR